MNILLSLISGIIFSAGLSISGMINPEKVIGFLDIFSLHGPWDPSLVFVMGGAVGFNLITFNFFRNRKPLFSNESYIPTKTDFDRRLIIGSALFGLGWGLMGICPGPGIVNLILGHLNSILFVISMLVGMILFKVCHR